MIRRLKSLGRLLVWQLVLFQAYDAISVLVRGLIARRCLSDPEPALAYLKTLP